jgi:SAM-dependent methyltransferase
MATLRRPFQGVATILRFNWHFFVLAAGASALLVALGASSEGALRTLAFTAAVGVAGTILLSLTASWYVYDLSGLYDLEWIPDLGKAPGRSLVNVHAGFDETSALLRQRYPDAAWTVLDFYDPSQHTEVSIRRARRACPPSPEDIRVDTTDLPLADESTDVVFAILAAHEIRGSEERAAFFRELHRALGPGGKVVIAEHLRDGYNLAAYTVGAFHFIPRRAWLRAFEEARLRLVETRPVNPFITCFVLEKNAEAP